jgi:hypothetical protein
VTNETDQSKKNENEKAAEDLRADRDDSLGYSREQFDFKKKNLAAKKPAKKAVKRKKK